MTPARVAVLGLLLALMIVLKYSLGFVPGIEVISFMFIMLGIFLPAIDLILLISAFNALILVLYGFGNWWLMYWVIWPVDAFMSKAISKGVRNRFVFGLWGFIAGASVGFWYFWSDWLFFGLTFARLNVFTAIPINAIEGLVTMLSVIIIGPYLAKVFARYSNKFWSTDKPFMFSEIKRPKFNLFFTTLFSLASLGGVVALYVKNDFFFTWKNQESKKYYTSHMLETSTKQDIVYDPNDIYSLDGLRTQRSKFDPNLGGGEGHHILFGSDYNEILNTMKKMPGEQVAIVVIANGKFYTDIINVKITSQTKAGDVMKSSNRFCFKTYTPPIGMGKWIQTFKFKKYKTQKETNFLHGKSNSKNYGDYYPLYYYNHLFANLGISNQTIMDNAILEITYDHNA